ncbi:AGAP013217-PA [Anopheles gambiae str. PEST]|uniref:AGAP013217-PA n=1 Tax=Anopheles gambiae TaxID=7165 RepID=F5HLB1_ANOGA|nr:AGAP013217-PA [Anopheles gambiae str. PEST]
MDGLTNGKYVDDTKYIHGVDVHHYPDTDPGKYGNCHQLDDPSMKAHYGPPQPLQQTQPPPSSQQQQQQQQQTQPGQCQPVGVDDPDSLGMVKAEENVTHSYSIRKGSQTSSAALLSANPPRQPPYHRTRYEQFRNHFG